MTLGTSYTGSLPGTIMEPNLLDHGTVLFLSTRRCEITVLGIKD